MYTFENISEINKDNCPGYYEYVEIKKGNERCVLTKKYIQEYLQKIKEFEVFEDDIWVITFPKCGTTWTQEISWLLNNDLNYEVEKRFNIDERFPFIEVGGIVNEKRESLKTCNELQRPRHIKSHLPVFLLPDQLWTVKPKIIYVCRNPKDAAVSYYHHYRHLVGYTGTKDEFFDLFLNDKLLHSPMNQQVLEFWERRNEPNILFLFFEDMKRDTKMEVQKIMNFLNKSYTEEQIDNLCQHVSFESMKNNPSCNRQYRVQMVKTTRDFISKNEKFSFLREGKIGSFDREMTDNQKRKFDEYMNFGEFLEAGFSYKTS